MHINLVAEVSQKSSTRELSVRLDRFCNLQSGKFSKGESSTKEADNKTIGLKNQIILSIPNKNCFFEKTTKHYRTYRKKQR